MLAVTVGLLITLAVALGVMFLVAFPYLRSGSRILTPDGERAVERAKEQAKQKPVAAAGSTWHGLIALERRISRAWGPVSNQLHEALDRLEGRDAPGAGAPAVGRPSPTGSRPEAGPVPDGQLEASPQRHVAGSVRPAGVQPQPQARFDVEAVAGGRTVGRPRPIPVDSGPIPEIDGPARGVGASADGPAPDDPRVIDLRGNDGADHPAGSARHRR